MIVREAYLDFLEMTPWERILLYTDDTDNTRHASRTCEVAIGIKAEDKSTLRGESSHQRKRL